MFKEKINLHEFCCGIALCAFWFGALATLVGKSVGDPSIITWWDAIWIPICVSVLPFLVGLKAAYKKEDVQKKEDEEKGQEHNQV